MTVLHHLPSSTLEFNAAQVRRFLLCQRSRCVWLHQQPPPRLVPHVSCSIALPLCCSGGGTGQLTTARDRYTHAPLPRAALASASAANQQCFDAPAAVARDAANRPLTCAALAHLCSSHEQVASVCPLSCGRCRAASSTGLQHMDVPWQPLLWKNLPSHRHVAPLVSSPYHYR